MYRGRQHDDGGVQHEAVLPAVLTPRQADVLHCIQRLTAQMGWPPTIHELARELGLSGTRIRQHLAALKKRRAISREIATARSVRTVVSGSLDKAAL